MSIFKAFESRGYVPETRAREQMMLDDMHNHFKQFGALAPPIDLARVTQAAAGGSPFMSDILRTQHLSKSDHMITSRWKEARLQAQREQVHHSRDAPSTESVGSIQSVHPAESVESVESVESKKPSHADGKQTSLISNTVWWITGCGAAVVVIAIIVAMAVHKP